MSDILHRIQKLLKLAANSSNEHEAASAASRASALMEEHEITEAEVRAHTDGPPKPAEPIVEGVRASHTRKKVAWHAATAHAVMALHNVRFFYRKGSIMFFGRLTETQAACYVFQYLQREIDGLCDRFGAGQTKSWRNAFRIGCAHRIKERIVELNPRPVDAPTTRDKRKPKVRAARPMLAAVTNNGAAPTSAALMIVERDRQEVLDAYAAYAEKNWGKRSGRAFKTPASDDGYHTGKRAGERVVLTRAKADLNRGTEVLP